MEHQMEENMENEMDTVVIHCKSLEGDCQYSGLRFLV